MERGGHSLLGQSLRPQLRARVGCSPAGQPWPPALHAAVLTAHSLLCAELVFRSPRGTGGRQQQAPGPDTCLPGWPAVCANEVPLRCEWDAPLGFCPISMPGGVFTSSCLARVRICHHGASSQHCSEHCQGRRGGRLAPTQGFCTLGPAGCPTKHASLWQPSQILSSYLPQFLHLRNGAAMQSYLTGQGSGRHGGW